MLHQRRRSFLNFHLRISASWENITKTRKVSHFQQSVIWFSKFLTMQDRFSEWLTILCTFFGFSSVRCSRMNGYSGRNKCRPLNEYWYAYCIMFLTYLKWGMWASREIQNNPLFLNITQHRAVFFLRSCAFRYCDHLTFHMNTSETTLEMTHWVVNKLLSEFFFSCSLIVSLQSEQ